MTSSNQVNDIKSLDLTKEHLELMRRLSGYRSAANPQTTATTGSPIDYSNKPLHTFEEETDVYKFAVSIGIQNTSERIIDSINPVGSAKVWDTQVVSDISHIYTILTEQYPSAISKEGINRVLRKIAYQGFNKIEESIIYAENDSKKQNLDQAELNFKTLLPD